MANAYETTMSRQTALFEELRRVCREPNEDLRLDRLKEWWSRHVTGLHAQVLHDRLSLRCIKDPDSLREWTWAEVARDVSKRLLTDMVAERSLDYDPATGDERQMLSVLVLK